MSEFRKSAVDWAMDSAWTLVLDRLRRSNPTLWNRLYDAVESNHAISRSALVALFSVSGGMFHNLPFLKPLMEQFGSDALAQSPGAIVNYFRRQTASGSRAHSSSESLESLFGEAGPYLQSATPNAEGSHLSWKKFWSTAMQGGCKDDYGFSPEELMARVRPAFATYNSEPTTGDTELLDGLEVRLKVLPPNLYVFVQNVLMDGVWDVNYREKQLLQEQTEPAKQLYVQRVLPWYERRLRASWLNRDRLQEIVDIPIEEFTSAVQDLLSRLSNITEEEFVRASRRIRLGE